MLLVYKKLFALYFITGILGLFSLIVLIDNIFIAVPTAFLWVFICAVVFQIIANTKYKKIVDLNNNCKIAEYLDRNSVLLSKATDKAVRDVLIVNMVVGCINIGDFERADRLIKSLEPNFKNTANGNYSAAVYYSHLCQYYISVHEFEKARSTLDTLKIYINDRKLTQLHKNDLEKRFTANSFSLDIAKGEFSGAEKYYIHRKGIENILISKVTSSYHLAKIYLNTDRAHLALPELEYIIQNGGDTYYKKWAKEEIKKNPTIKNGG